MKDTAIACKSSRALQKRKDLVARREVFDDDVAEVKISVARKVEADELQTAFVKDFHLSEKAAMVGSAHDDNIPEAGSCYEQDEPWNSGSIPLVAVCDVSLGPDYANRSFGELQSA